jgi:hypothetical protein
MHHTKRSVSKAEERLSFAEICSSKAELPLSSIGAICKRRDQELGEEGNSDVENIVCYGSGPDLICRAGKPDGTVVQ